MNAQENTKALGGRWHGNYGMVSCPVPSHGRGRGDRNPSLSVGGEGGTVLVHCHAGCDQQDVINALRRARRETVWRMAAQAGDYPERSLPDLAPFQQIAHLNAAIAAVEPVAEE